MIRAILWDNDGVLVDTEKLYFQASREVLSEVGIDLTTDLFSEISLRQGRSIFELASAQGVKPDVIDRLHTKRNRRHSELLRNGVPILDGVQETLSRLQGKVIMGIVTSCRKLQQNLCVCRREEMRLRCASQISRLNWGNLEPSLPVQHFRVQVVPDSCGSNDRPSLGSRFHQPLGGQRLDRLRRDQVPAACRHPGTRGRLRRRFRRHTGRDLFQSRIDHRAPGHAPGGTGPDGKSAAHDRG